MQTYASDFTIKLKLGAVATLQTTGKLIGIHKPVPKEAKTSLVAPGTADPVKQFYVPESLVSAGVSSFTRDQLLTAADCDRVVAIKNQMTGETEYTPIPKEALKEVAKSDLPKNIMNVTVHTVDDIDQVMFPMKDAQSYVFYPNSKDPDNLTNYTLLVAVLNRSDLAFASVVNLQNHEGLFRLQMWRGRIALVRQGWPDGINEHENPSEDEFKVAPIPDAVIEKAIKGFTKMVEPIDPDTYKDRILAEKVALKTAIDKGEAPVVAEAKEVSVDALSALLDAFGED
jgi:hypothetical protein